MTPQRINSTLDVDRSLGRDDGTALWMLILVMALVVTPMIVLAEIVAYWRTDVVDDQMFAYYGWRIAHGATVYLDVWDNKPPGIYWANALAMLVSGGSYVGVIVVCGLALAVAHAAFFVAGAAVYSRGAAALTTILLSFYLTHAYYTGGTDRTETFLVPCELIGVAFYLRGFARERWWKWYAAGLFCGLAFLFKQVGLAAWGCMGLHIILLVIMRDLTLRAGVRRCLLLLGGVVTTVGVAAFVLASQGALGAACFATFGFNWAYVTAGRTQFPYNFANRKVLELHMYPILLVPMLMSAAAVIHAALWWWRPQHRPPEIEAPLRAQRPACPRYMVFFVLWLLVAVYGAVLSPHAFRHYVNPIIPPLLLIAGYLVNVLRAETRLLRRMQQRAWVTLSLVVLAYFGWGAVVEQKHAVSKVWVFRIDPTTREPAVWEVVGDAVAELTDPGDRIQCWEYLPGVYLRSRRINATRFSTTEKVGQVSEGARFVVNEMATRLRADPPVLLVLSAGYCSLMKSERPDERPLDSELAPWIDENYTLVREIPRFGTYLLFKRNDLVDD